MPFCSLWAKTLCHFDGERDLVERTHILAPPDLP